MTLDTLLAMPNAAAPELPKELIHSARKGEVKRVVKWLRQGGHVDAACTSLTGNALLHSAAVHEQLELMKELLERGAAVNLQNAEGSTALMAASEQARFGTEAARLLLEHRASVDLRASGGITALMSAARCGHTAIVDLLLDNAADPDLQNDNGGTALMQAAGAGHTACAEALLNAGANMELRTDKGRTALHFAEKYSCRETAQLLRERALARPPWQYLKETQEIT